MRVRLLKLMMADKLGGVGVDTDYAIETARADAMDLFAGPGEVRAVARVLDWSKTPLGPTPGWSPALRTR